MCRKERSRRCLRRFTSKTTNLGFSSCSNPQAQTLFQCEFNGANRYFEASRSDRGVQVRALIVTTLTLQPKLCFIS
jgi:hypothetical protein